MSFGSGRNLYLFTLWSEANKLIGDWLINLFPGETPLHLAARYSRADNAKRLLEAPDSDPNAQDSSGRTPLHSAVAADAIGVFQVGAWYRYSRV